MVAALLGLTPGLARGEVADAALQLAGRVNAMNAAGDFAGAAKLAAASAADARFEAPLRVMFGGLARLNYELSYGAGGGVADLCALRAVMWMVEPLAADGGGRQQAAAEEAEARLEQTQGARWRAVCGLEAPEASGAGEAGASAMKRTSEPTPPAAPRVEPVRAVSPERTERASPAERRRLRAGVATLIPGLLLFAPMAAVLAYRTNGEQELRVLQGATQGREASEAETERALLLRQRYRGTTAGAVALGATGAALAVTGLVLLATRGRSSRVAVAPWGACGVGGVVIEGRF